jgi:hypothetical protein
MGGGPCRPARAHANSCARAVAVGENGGQARARVGTHRGSKERERERGRPSESPIVRDVILPRKCAAAALGFSVVVGERSILNVDARLTPNRMG